MDTQNQKAVLITGAKGSLGSAVLNRFCQDKDLFSQIVAWDREGDKGATLSGVKWLCSDLSDPSSVQKKLESLVVEGVDLGTLVHCVGGFRFSALEETRDEDFEFLLNANLKSTYYLLRSALPIFKKRGFGRIVLIGAKASLQSPAGMSAYGASKAGLNALVSSAAEEVKKFDINVNAVLPTVLDTPMNRQEMPDADHSTWVPLDQLAEIVFSLTQPWGKPIHGALIPVSGRL